MRICASQFDALLHHLGENEDAGCSVQEPCQRTKWNCDIDIMESLIDTFVCLFPDPGCYCPCHAVDDAPCAHCQSSCTACNFGFWEEDGGTEEEEKTTSLQLTELTPDDDEENILLER